MKAKTILLIFMLSALFISACGTPSPSPGATLTPVATTTPTPTETTSASPEATADVKTSASIVDTAAAFQTAISNKGTWIICIIKDLSIDKDLVLDGEFKNGKKDTNGNDIVQRKIALYAQDENRNITARYTLTAPKLTVNSPKASIQHGTFKGDVYVTANDFELVDATIEGNLYFQSNTVKNSFKMDATSKVTGKQEVKTP